MGSTIKKYELKLNVRICNRPNRHGWESIAALGHRPGNRVGVGKSQLEQTGRTPQQHNFY